MPRQGHRVDSNTIALWRFDETDNADYTLALDSVGTLHFTQSLNADIPLILGGPAGLGQNTRWFAGSTDNMASPLSVGSAAADLAARLTGSNTVECWVYPRAFSGDSTLINAGADGESLATNYLLWWRIDSSGNQVSFWESGAPGDNTTETQSSGDILTLDEWQHVAMSHEVVGGVRVVRWYRNGLIQDFVTSSTNAEGDLSAAAAELIIGEEQTDGGDFWSGGISDFRLSDFARTDAEILASFSASNFQHDIDSNTYALWRFAENPEVKDISGNGIHLSPIDFDDIGIITPPLVRDEGKSRFCSSAKYFKAPSHPVLATAFSGSCTVEFWGQFGANSLDAGIMSYGGGGTTTEANNILLSARIDWSVPRAIRWFWEEGAGANIASVGTVENFTLDEAKEVFHYAIVKDVTAASGTVDLRIYVNGSLIEEIADITNCTGGTAVASELLIAASDESLADVHWNGFMGDMRISSIARSVNEINQSFLDGLDIPFRTYPQVTRVKP